MVTLVVFSQWARFPSERDFYRYAQSKLRPAFPALHHHSQFNRLTRRYYGTPTAFFPHPVSSTGQALVDLPPGPRCRYEARDSSGVSTRSLKRRGAGWAGGYGLEQPPGLV